MSWTELPLAVNVGIFTGCALVIWVAGWRISKYADVIRERTGASEALVGLVLLGGITSLPELAISVTGAVAGDADLTVNNILGSVAMQVAILAIADAAIGRDALSSVVVAPTVLLQAVLDIVLLTLVAAATLVGDFLLFGIGAWSWGLLATYVVAVWLVASMKPEGSWRAPRREGLEEPRSRDAPPDVPLARTIGKAALAAAAILIAGYAITRSGEAIAGATGLGSSFFGAVILAIATSLPELSTVLSAVRLRRYEMAVGDIFGTNLFDVMLIFVIDLTFSGGPVLSEVGPFATFGALLGIVLTAILLLGLIERNDRVFLRMGFDSIAVLLLYAGGIVLLSSLRS